MITRYIPITVAGEIAVSMVLREEKIRNTETLEVVAINPIQQMNDLYPFKTLSAQGYDFIETKNFYTKSEIEKMKLVDITQQDLLVGEDINNLDLTFLFLKTTYQVKNQAVVAYEYLHYMRGRNIPSEEIQDFLAQQS